MAERLRIEVVAGSAEQQVLVSLRLRPGATVAEAVAAAALGERLPELDVDEGCVGIFGKRCRPDQVLADGDRVEVYRALKADPKTVRRELAELERSRGRKRV
jgi:putative ubiquitin-RnfH superfamily antitoxin RatB of RatAB toxin-antitoxin module